MFIKQADIGVLLHLKKDKEFGDTYDVSFSELAETLDMPEEELDDSLNRLEMDRYINQFVQRKKDIFHVQITEKGFEME